MKQLMMIAATALALTASAQAPMRGPGPAFGPSLEPVVRFALNEKSAEKIGITPEQAAKLKALPDEREALKGLHEKARKCMERQAELLKAETVDEAAVMAALDEAWAARKEVAKLQTKRLIAVRGILTDEQISKAREAMKEMRGNHGKRPRPQKAKPPAPPAD